MSELAALVAAALRERRLELVIRQAVDEELARVVGEVVEQELAARRNTDRFLLPQCSVRQRIVVRSSVRVARRLSSL